MIKYYITMLKTILNFLFPQKCLGCKEKNEILCRKCFSKIDNADLPKDGWIFSASNYQDKIVKKAVWLLKYGGVKRLAEPMAELINERLWTNIKEESGSAEPALIPIPLSGKRLQQRGYNQAELIARQISQNVMTGVLCKNIHTESQVSVKDKSKRLNNIKGSFIVKNPELVKGKEIILIDDICTTGATLKEAKKVLKEAGAKKVLAAVVARG